MNQSAENAAVCATCSGTGIQPDFGPTPDLVPCETCTKPDAIRPERTENPAYLSRGAWYVDDGMQVVFFDTEGEAQQYADLCIASDRDAATRRTNPPGQPTGDA